jgi:translation initiation factor 1
MPEQKSKLVYSTEKVVPRKGMPVEHSSQAVAPAAQQRVTVRLDRKGRGGKTVTVVEGLRMLPKKMEELLRQFKARLGTGGTIKDAALEIQGDHRDAIMSELQIMGFTPKRSGG